MDEPLTHRQSQLQTCIAGLLGMGLMWLAHPPVGFSFLAWIAPLPLLSLVHRNQPLFRRDYVCLWLIGALFWFIALSGIRHAHPMLIPAWIVLAAYLGIYTPLFVGLTRVAWHGWRMPLVVAAPAVWIGLELARGYALSGFNGVMLGHTQANLPWMLQIADLGGTYAVSAVVMFVSAALAVCLHCRRLAGTELSVATSRRRQLHAILNGTAVLAATLGYGLFRLREAETVVSPEPMLKVALVQRDVEAVYEYSEQRELETARKYFSGSRDAVSADPGVQLVVWPESSYTAAMPWRVLEDDFTVPADAGMTRAEIVAGVRDSQNMFQRRAADIQLGLTAASGRSLPPSLMVGCSVLRYVDGPVQVFSGVVTIDPTGKVPAWYGKRHLVMFGEYIPFANRFPWLYTVTPLQMGVTPGDAPIVADVKGVKVLPSVCFETMVERVTNKHLRQLAAEGKPADLVVNVTNDGWFDDSAILEHHRRCSQLVAAAHHTPVLMAANGGPTVSIDSSGRVVGRLPHQDESFLIADPRQDPRVSFYQRVGDWPARFATLLCISLAISGCRGRRRRKKQLPLPSVESPTDLIGDAGSEPPRV
ncbi:Apolipoprotein N-acyltransferase [Rosistilla carotiformis]|uniref:Apolipoprotein N-acyltransferase n=1 Tax=Rosistilla carotiformis TaxID=2528017 RepID=A0A518JPV6_9BACT|nr:apolipoprotein N-acyltransferase [Rosistilla carotiformis]QDV67575.1 Apolipoprotein N-acyltransferase [Rosistilla carotiformis]